MNGLVEFSPVLHFEFWCGVWAVGRLLSSTIPLGVYYVSCNVLRACRMYSVIFARVVYVVPGVTCCSFTVPWDAIVGIGV